MTDVALRSPFLDELLQEGVNEAAFPSAATWVAHRLEPRAVGFAGKAHLDSVWDVASLTKPMVVASLAMKAIAAGVMDLEEVVFGTFTLRQLLGHRSGLPALDDLVAFLREDSPDWSPGAAGTRDRVIERILSLPRDPGCTCVYSDLGYILLGYHLESRLGAPLHALDAGFGITPGQRDRTMPTGHCWRRGRELLGEVHDPNAWALGGVGGHAGTFATLDEVGFWALDLARADAGEESSFDQAVVQQFWDCDARPDEATWVLGFDTPTPGSSLAGSVISPRSVGHYGYTGVSVWIDREYGSVVVLLTNRSVWGQDAKPKIKAFRPRFHDAVFSWMRSAGRGNLGDTG